MSLLHRFHEGGIFMYVILIFAAFTLGLIIERTLALFYKIKNPQKGFREQVLSFVSRADFEGAKNFVQSSAGTTALGRVTALGCELRETGGAEAELQARMDEKLTAEISNIDRRTGFLAMSGNVATLLGLLGTITGMIQSFAAVAQSSPADRATMLSKGISEAMNCTAFGLLVAIPALVAYAIFQNKTDKLVSSLTESTTEIFHDLLFLSESKRLEAPKSRSEKVKQSETALNN